MTKVISFDVDGVVAEGKYLLPEYQTPEMYDSLKLFEESVPNILNKLSYEFDVYFVSSRSFDGAVRVTKEWLRRNGIWVERMGGVVCGIKPHVKPGFVEGLGGIVHFDDDPRVIEEVGCIKGVLFHHPGWYENERLFKHIGGVETWDQVEEVVRKAYVFKESVWSAV